jgi:hypothetical protein
MESYRDPQQPTFWSVHTSTKKPQHRI